MPPIVRTSETEPSAERSDSESESVCMCVYIYVCMYVYMYIYVHVMLRSVLIEAPAINALFIYGAALYLSIYLYLDINIYL
jgi:hypothetical protein